MKLGWRSGIGLILTGVVLGGVVSAVAQDPSPSEGEPAIEEARRPMGGPHGIHGGLVRSESVVEGDEDGEFLTVRVDRGVLQSVDGSTLVIEEADGETVRVPTDDDTVIHRDGDEADVGDLEEGDHVGTFREKSDGEYVTKRVRALSAERYAEFEQRREDRRELCRSNPERCRARMRTHGRMLRDRMLDEGLSDVEPAPEASAA